MNNTAAATHPKDLSDEQRLDLDIAMSAVRPIDFDDIKFQFPRTWSTAPARYDVVYNGVTLGWVWKDDNGKWDGWQVTNRSDFTGRKVVAEEPTRRAAAEEIFAAIRAYGFTR